MTFSQGQLAVLVPLVVAFVLGVGLEVVGLRLVVRRSRWGRRLLALAFFVFWTVVAAGFLGELAVGLADQRVGLGGVAAFAVAVIVATRLPAVWRLPPP